MKSFPLLILAVSLTAFASLANAQLDETPAQCEARYGKSTEQWDDEEVPGAKCCRYEKDELEIDVTFLGDHAASVAFSKLNNTDFSDAEIDALLVANKGSSSWGAPGHEKKAAQDGKPEAWWDRADDGASASYWYDEESKRRTFDVETGAYSKAQEDAEAKKKSKHGKH